MIAVTDDKAYMTTPEAADHLRFDGCANPVKAFLEFARTHHIPRCRRGRAVLWRKQDLDAAVAPAAAHGAVRHFFGSARKVAR